MTPLHAVLGERYAEVIGGPYAGHRTDLTGYSKPLFRWLWKAAQMVAFAEQARGQGSCYFGKNGNDGMQALKNARQFLSWATLELDMYGAPQ